MFFPTDALAESDPAPISLGGHTLKPSSNPYDASYQYLATPRQRQLGLIFCVAMVLATVALLPVAHTPAGRFAHFFSPYHTPSIISCLITAYLMFGYFKATQTVALLYLSAGYLYTASVLLMQSLPGNSVQNERLLSSGQDTIWLWVFWHLGLALSVLCAARNHHRQSDQLAATGGNALRNTALGWLAATTLTVVLVFGLSDWLPVLDVEGDFSRITTTGIAPAMQLLLAAAVLSLWRASRFRNVLHIWLGVVLVALLCEITLVMVAGSQLMLGWYAGRIGWFIGLSVMTLVYMKELKDAYLNTLATTKQLAISNAKLDSDVRERSLYAENLMQADERKDQFLAMLAHELRNPLAPISAAAELLSLGNLSQEMLYKTSSIITRQINHMTSLVDDLLDVSRVNKGLIELNRTQVDMKQVIADAHEQARPLIDALQHRISVQLTSEAAWVTGDHKRLVQVTANLLNNSAKYTLKKGNISVRLDATETHIEMIISDDGIGISAQLLANIFGLFVQGQRTPDRAQGGLGLGLAIVKSLVELHGGSVSAHSYGNDKGSEFTIRLPRLLVQSDCPGHTEPAPAVSQVIRPKAFILIVDDNVDAAKMLGALLKANGFRVAVEHDALSALKRAGQETFDAFFLDIGMPGMDGCGLVQRLRALPQSRTKLMVAITGYGTKSDRQKFFEAGFDEHLVKPACLKKTLEMLDRIT